MKFKLYLCSIFSFLTCSCFGQQFIDYNNQWQVSECCYNFATNQINCSPFLVRFLDSTLIDGLMYHSIQTSEDNLLFPISEGYYREENSQVFLKPSLQEDEYLIYDFSALTGDTICIGPSTNPNVNCYEVLSIDSLELASGDYRKTFSLINLHNQVNYEWVEGIGSLGNSLNPTFDIALDCWPRLDCYEYDKSIELQIRICDLITHFKEVTILDSFSLVKNPTNDFLILNIRSQDAPVIRLTNIEGTFSMLVDSDRMSVQNLPSGLYLLTAEYSSGKSVTKKVVIQH